MPSIAHVVRSDSFAGVERYVCGVAGELAHRGYAVRVVGGDPVRMQAELDGRVPYLPAISTLDSFRALTQVGRLDLVHAHMTAAEVASVCARFAHRAPVISTRHFPSRRGRSVPIGIGRSFGHLLAGQVATSRFVADAIVDRSVVIHSGVSERPQSDLRSPHVLMLQRLEPEKSPEVGLRAWAASGLGERGWTLWIAGTGSMAAGLRALCASLGVGETVRFLGVVGDTDDLLQRSSILLAPAGTDSFGLSVVEAMAHGVPVVAARGGGHVETLGDDGLLFRPGDVDSAASQLERLAGSPAMREDVGHRLRLRQQRMFSLRVHVDRLERFYASFLS